MKQDENGFIYVIFDASGDLTRRKLIPALYSLFVQGLLPENFAVIGVARSGYSEQEYRDRTKTALGEFNETDITDQINDFSEKLFYTSLLYDAADSYWKLKERISIIGKETVQNLLVTRFSNGICEPLWNRRYIRHVEVTSSESLGVERRGGYYDDSGALRDMVQNHLLQVVALTAMEPPATMEPNAIRNEILKVFQSLRPISEEQVGVMALRGQYTSSDIQSEHWSGYREEEGVRPDSTTETYAALKFYIDNWRWGGVPFYIYTGKRLSTRVTDVVIHFRETPHFLFSIQPDCDKCNQLILRLQPDEGILLRFGMKTPGAGFKVQNVHMDFHYSDLSDQRIPSAYERLIYDSIRGDSTLFSQSEEVIEAWKFLIPVLNAWKNNPEIPLYGYPAGTWGPERADEFIDEKGMTWRYPCKNLTSEGGYCEL